MDRRYNLRSSSASRSDRHRSRYSSNNSDGGSANRYADRSSPVRYSESKRVVDDDSRFTTSSSSVQRVLYRSDDDDDDDDDDNDRKERDSAENVYRSRTRRSSSSHSDDKDDDSDNTRSDSDDREDERDRSAGHLKKKRFAAQYRRKATFAEGLRRRLALPERARHVVEFVQRLVNTVLRNSFMLCNVLWLLTPLGCFIIAVVVPTHLTRAMGYADMLANIGTPAAGNTTAGYGQVYESGSLKSIVQEIVDVKLSAVREEVLGLQQIVTAQREELEALRLLHESMRQVNEEHQKKFSLTDSQSALSIHIERTLSKSVDELRSKVDKEATVVEQRLAATERETSDLQKLVRDHQEELEAIQRIARDAAASSGNPSNYETDRELRQQFKEWKLQLEQDMSKQVHAVEDRISSSLLSEKQLLFESLDSLSNLNLDDPGLITLIQDAVVEAEARKQGRTDYASLANGAKVIYSKADLMLRPKASTLRVLSASTIWRWFGKDKTLFTSSSYCRAPSILSGALSALVEQPMWLSRHNGRPETALSETMEVGSCWTMAGRSGRLSVRFGKRILADAVTIDHLPELTAADFSTAPQHFQVWGLVADRRRESIERYPLGNFTYVRNGPSSQVFKLSTHTSIDGAMLEITSNYGHSEYTCLYRFRLHGKPV